MAGATPNYTLPYPVPDDTVDVPRDVKALADKLDTLGLKPDPTFHTAGLPPAPVDGQIAYFLADSANGVVWQLRYRAAAPNIRKWEAVGGRPLFAYWSGNGNASGVPVLSLPIIATGEYLIEAGLRCQHNLYPWGARVGIRDGAGVIVGDGNIWPWVASDGSGGAAFARYTSVSNFNVALAASTYTLTAEDLANNPVFFMTWFKITPLRF